MLRYARLLACSLVVTQAARTGAARLAAPERSAMPQRSTATARAASPAGSAARVRDDSLAGARAALAARRPWRATQLLRPVLAAPASHAPATVLLAAEAAAAWGGWRQVNALLAGAPWVDTLTGGRGRELLARAALGASPRTPSLDSAAVVHAAAAVPRAATPRARAERLVLLARALDRLERRDSARASYLRAADALPEVGDWLRLRAAGVTADSAGRARLYVALRSPAARARAPWTEAEARARMGDTAGAVRSYAALGATGAALRLRMAVASPEERQAMRGELVALVTGRPGASAAGAALEVLDRWFDPLSPAEQLAAARSAAAAGPRERALEGYATALEAGLGTSRDRFGYATLLSRAGRDAEAAAQFARVAEPRPLAATAAYQRARSLLRAGRGDDARAALRRVSEQFAAEPDGAAPALYLLADLATDDGRDAEARRTFRLVAERYPASGLAPTAAFRAAVIALVAGDAAAAARELDSLAVRYPASDERLAAGYWAGRAWAQLGNDSLARARWRAVAAREPLSYYAMASARRLGEPVWAPAAAGDTLPRDPAVDAAVGRTRLLARLGLDPEVQLEYARLTEEASASTARLLATARAFQQEDAAGRAIALGRRALERGAPRTAAVYRLVYPVGYEQVLRVEASANALDPSLVAALIRQESSFTPAARSPVGARGLMQIMPVVGGRLARSLDFPVWDAVLLDQPDVSLQLGTRHLAGVLAQYEHPAYALAAYNAGASRVDRWRRKPGGMDHELFIERIPYTETRDYVRIILRNRELYASLYGW